MALPRVTLKTVFVGIEWRKKCSLYGGFFCLTHGHHHGRPSVIQRLSLHLSTHGRCQSRWPCCDSFSWTSWHQLLGERQTFPLFRQPREGSSLCGCVSQGWASAFSIKEWLGLFWNDGSELRLVFRTLQGNLCIPCGSLCSWGTSSLRCLSGEHVRSFILSAEPLLVGH